MQYPIQQLTILEHVDDRKDHENDTLSLVPQDILVSAKKKTTSVYVGYREKLEIDSHEKLKSFLFEDISRRTQKELSNLYSDLGKINRLKLLTRWQRFVKRIFKNLEFPIYTKNPDMKILDICLLIDITSNRGPGNFCIVGSKLGSFLNSLSEKISVFVIPYFDDTVVIGRTTNLGEPGVIYGEFAHKFVEMDVAGLDNIKTKIFLDVEETIQEVGKHPESNYITERIIVGEKPIWRKFCNL